MFPKDAPILVVDDSPTARVLVKDLLFRLGFKNTIEAEDGLAALEVIEEVMNQGTEISFVIADWNMPRMNGLDLLVYLKQNQKYSTIPFLMFTAESDVSLVTLAISNGADEFIVKPVTEENLLKKMEIIWKKTKGAPAK